MKLKIDKDVKIPSISNRISQYREIIANMEEGDSVGDLTQNQSNALVQVMRKNGIKAVTRKMEKGGVDDLIYRVWHDGLLETTDEQGTLKIGSPTNPRTLAPGILQEAEAHEDKHNIVEDTKEVFKIVNEELYKSKKEDRGDES